MLSVQSPPDGDNEHRRRVRASAISASVERGAVQIARGVRHQAGIGDAAVGQGFVKSCIVCRVRLSPDGVS